MNKQRRGVINVPDFKEVLNNVKAPEYLLDFGYIPSLKIKI